MTVPRFVYLGMQQKYMLRAIPYVCCSEVLSDSYTIPIALFLTGTIVKVYFKMSSRFYFAWRMLYEGRRLDVNNLMRRTRANRREFDAVNDVSDNEFKKRYRFTKEAFLFLCDLLGEVTELKSTQRVSLELKVLSALFFYAHGEYQRPVGLAESFSQQAISVYLDEVTEALNHPNVANLYIKFPTTREARARIQEKFYTKFGIPGIIECVDGCHVKIFKPILEEEHLYYSRKHVHTINVQMICDIDCRILAVNAKFGGATHDAFIWDNSQINTYMQSLHRNGEIVWLLGDSGYPQRPWLMTPCTNPASGSREAQFNRKHGTARVLIENTFGRLKNKWRCLCKDRVPHYTPKKACCVLYNLGVDLRVPEFQVNETSASDPNDYESDEPDEEEEDELLSMHQDPQSASDLIRGRAMRQQLIRRIC